MRTKELPACVRPLDWAAPLRGANQSFDLTFRPVNRASRADCQGKKSVNSGVRYGNGKSIVKNRMGFDCSFPLLRLILLPFLPLIVLFGSGRAIYGLRVKRSFCTKWSKQGKFVLYGLFGEPKLAGLYVEGHSIARIEAEAVILNWSKRSLWKLRCPALKH